MNRSSINKAILVGRVGDKPEARYTPNGTSTASFSLATNEVWGSGEDKREHTEWHNIVTWNKTAEYVSDYIYKGQLVCIEGRIRTRSWKDKTEMTRKTTEIVAESVIALEWKSKDSSTKQTKSEKEDESDDLPF